MAIGGPGTRYTEIVELSPSGALTKRSRRLPACQTILDAIGNLLADGRQVEEFQLPVLSPGAMTDHGKLFSIDCFVQIELDVPWAKDAKIRVPVTLW